MLFDQGALGIQVDHTVLVSRHFLGRGPAAGELVLGLVGRPLLGPQRGEPLPAPEYLKWHLKPRCVSEWDHINCTLCCSNPVDATQPQAASTGQAGISFRRCSVSP